MEYWDKFVSNSCAGSSNQHSLELSDSAPRTARIFYKIFAGGEYSYSLLFSSIINGSYRRISHANDICDTWQIHELRVGRCRHIPKDRELSELIMGKDIEVDGFTALTFSGHAGYKPVGGELFTSDPVTLDFDKDDYLCLEITYSGEKIPYHPESQIPIYLLEGDEWKYSVETPIAEMIGCDRRPPSGKIGFLGDSITQGCGAGLNSYLHWNARLSEKIGNAYAYHNLGIGYGLATNAATDGVWLYKAKQNDIVFVCYGVNDINSEHDTESVIHDLSAVVDKLRDAGCRVILQTVPPFDYPPARRAVWEKVNEYIKNELSKRVELVFDCVPILSVSEEEPHMAKFGGHPNAVGCGLWADALYEAVKNIL